MININDICVKQCIHNLSLSNTVTDVILSWNLLAGKYPQYSGIVHLNQYSTMALPFSINKYTNEPFNYLVQYFKSEKLFFINDKILEDAYLKRKSTLTIDYTIMFDSNIATYVDKMIRGKPIRGAQNQFSSLINEILKDGLNFDTLFYMIENIKNVVKTADMNAKNALTFWKSLNVHFRRNLSTLKLFLSIDSQEYQKTSNTKFTISYQKALRNAVNHAYSFYALKDNLFLNEITLFQKKVLLNLIGMVKIQFSSKKSAKNKMLQYFDFMHNVIGAYLDREAVIAHKYYQSQNSLSILNRVHKGCKTTNLISVLDNIAWDMLAPRLMERFISLRFGENGNFFLPLFMTFDKDLKEILEMCSIKATIYERESSGIISIPDFDSKEYFIKNGLGEYLKSFFSDEQRQERESRQSYTMESITPIINSEYNKLLELLCLIILCPL